jgi:hypothetical protein
MSGILSDFNCKTFTDQLHSKFKVPVQGQEPIVLELIEVSERNTPKTEAFSLMFRGPAAPRLAQQTWEVEHEKLGTFPLFITALSANQEGITYESVFHRLSKDA